MKTWTYWNIGLAIIDIAIGIYYLTQGRHCLAVLDFMLAAVLLW